MKHLNAIFSGKYISPTLQAEFGRITPSNLPLNNKPLLEYQVSTLLPGQLYLNLPEDLERRQFEIINKSANINFLSISTPQESLLQAIHRAVERADLEGCESISLILGDTIIKNYNWKINTYSSHKGMTNYKWTPASMLGNVFSGYVNLGIQEAKKRFLLSDNFQNLDLGEVNLGGLEENHSGHWFDFGHYHNYHNSKKNFISHRFFNDIKSAENTFIKKSTNVTKIQAEASWFKSVPKHILVHCPQIFDFDEESYEIEHLYANSLAELLVFSSLPEDTWSLIYERIVALLRKFQTSDISSVSCKTLKDFAVNKVRTRLVNYKIGSISTNEQISFENECTFTVSEIVDFLDYNWPEELNGTYSVVHGDLCYSNILFDARSQQLKLIDPRGINEANEQSIHGYLEYDLAKLVHSCKYGYDFILSGQVSTSFVDGQLTSNYNQICIYTQQYLVDMITKEFHITEIHLNFITLSLFLSMIPLHEEDLERQLTFLYVAYLIYSDLKDGLQ